MEDDLDLPMSPEISRQDNISSKIEYSLVSIGFLFDAWFTFTFKINDVIFVYKDEIILWWWRNYQNKLLYLLLSVKNEDEQVRE